jgi:hypothetical protein
LDDEPDNPVVITGYKAVHTEPLTPAKKQVNKLIASVRAVCEHTFAAWLPASGLTPTGVDRDGRQRLRRSRS